MAPTSIDQAANAARFEMLMRYYPDTINALLANLESKTDTVKPVVSKHQALGTKAVSAISRNVFKFEDLPAELRTRIYELGMRVDGKIRVTRHYDRDSDDVAFEAWESNGRSSKSRPQRACYRLSMDLEERRSKTRRSTALRHQCALALLSANKSIHAEAYPIFYSQNSFIFNSSRAWTLFTDTITVAPAMLTRVEIQSVNFTNHLRALSRILSAVHLEAFKITLTGYFPHTTNAVAQRIVTALSLPVSSQQHCGGGCKGSSEGTCSCITNEQLERTLNALEVVDPRLFAPNNSTGVDQRQLKVEIKREWQRRASGG